MDEQFKSYRELVDLINSTQKDAEKVYLKANKTAGTRLRKDMQKIKELAQKVRIEVSEIKNNQ